MIETDEWGTWEVTVAGGVTYRKLLEPSQALLDKNAADAARIQAEEVAQERERARQAALETIKVKIALREAERMVLEDELPPEDAGTFAPVFTPWAPDVPVSVDDIREFEDDIYVTIQAHVTQSDWTPPTVPALFRKYGQATPGEPYPRWVQPTGGHDAYATGDRVVHEWEEELWVFSSKIDANTTEPGTDGTFHRWWEPVSTVATYVP